jgi:predicted DsbA family dithiol-disulfide isomerase
MRVPTVQFFFDYVCPLSFLLDRDLEALEAASLVRVERHPFELRPPPLALIDVEDPAWIERTEAASRAARERAISLTFPAFIPWTRKAHELGLHARQNGVFDVTHEALFRASAVEGRDLGRIDVLVDIALGLGLDGAETKAALDVDHHTAGVAELRAGAERMGVRGVPTLLIAARLVEGVPSPDALRSLLERTDSASDLTGSIGTE